MEDTRYIPPPSQCHLLPEQMWQLEYKLVTKLTRDEYFVYVNQGWRRFGNLLFHPQCPSCTACQPIRIPVETYRPNRSQKRVIKANANTKLVIRDPVTDICTLDVYARHHYHHAEQKGWPRPRPDEMIRNIYSITSGSLPVKEWAFYQEGKLLAVCYVDELPTGYSGIYSFHDPEFRKLSLGTWMCMSMIKEARHRCLPFVYLGYYVAGCRSMEYKGAFTPNQVLTPGGEWIDFLE